MLGDDVTIDPDIPGPGTYGAPGQVGNPVLPLLYCPCTALYCYVLPMPDATACRMRLAL